MENTAAAMIEAAKEITIAVLSENKALLDHGNLQSDMGVDQTIERVTKVYRAVFTQIRASYQGRLPAEVANVN